jgi:2-aminobenzoate-CoA ligase
VVPGYPARVVGEDGQELHRGSIGAIAVVGPTGCRYLDDTRQTSYVNDGWNYPATPLCRTLMATSSTRLAPTT